MSSEPALTREDLAILDALDEATPEQQGHLRREIDADPHFATEFRSVEDTVLTLDAAFRDAPTGSVSRPLPEHVLTRLRRTQRELSAGLPSHLSGTNAQRDSAAPPQPEVLPVAGTRSGRPWHGPHRGSSWAACAAMLVVIGTMTIVFINRPPQPEAATASQTEKLTTAGDATPAPALTASNSAETPSAVAVPAKIDLDPSQSKTRRVKEEVLTRIDLMSLSSARKDQLYVSVERARKMGKVLTVPFGKSFTALTTADIRAIKAELAKPELAGLLDDPTAVLVILGFADPKGDPERNRQISQQRADAVRTALRDQCGVADVLHSVAMGGSTLHDLQDAPKNRVAELWVVLP